MKVIETKKAAKNIRTRNKEKKTRNAEIKKIAETKKISKKQSKDKHTLFFTR